MKVMIVSFDRTLTEELKKVLKDFEVVVVKNSEEAINTVFPDIDIVVYDAISGAISEGDINKMYRRKFKDARYVILVDSLFPVDINNIEVPQKVALDREIATKNILSEITKPIIEHNYQEGTTFYNLDLQNELPQETIAINQYGGPQEEITIQKLKVLVVTFDEELINKLKSSLGASFEVITTTNKKEILDMASVVDVVVFDAMYGSMTQKILTDLSKDEQVQLKPFIILLDDLFPIDTDNIPLLYKYTFARESEYEKAVDQIMALASTTKKDGLLPQTPEMETPYQEPTSKEVEQDNLSIEALLSKVTPEEEKPESVTATTPEKGIPTQIAQEALSEALKGLEEKLSESVSVALSKVLEKLDMGFISDVLSSNISKQIESLNITNLVREEINKLMSGADVVEIIREETRKILKEKLEQLIK